MPLPVRAASTVEMSLGGHSSQSGAVAPTLAPAGAVAEAAPALDPLMLAEPKVLAPPDSGETAVVGKPVVTARVLPAEPSTTEAIEPPGSAVVVVDPDGAAVVAGDAGRLLAGEPMVWARAAAAMQQRQSSAESRADRYREITITTAFASGCHGPNGAGAPPFPG